VNDAPIAEAFVLDVEVQSTTVDAEWTLLLRSDLSSQGTCYTYSSSMCQTNLGEFSSGTEVGAVKTCS
jgi:hypothetical protein